MEEFIKYVCAGEGSGAFFISALITIVALGTLFFMFEYREFTLGWTEPVDHAVFSILYVFYVMLFNLAGVLIQTVIEEMDSKWHLSNIIPSIWILISWLCVEKLILFTDNKRLLRIVEKKWCFFISCIGLIVLSGMTAYEENTDYLVITWSVVSVLIGTFISADKLLNWESKTKGEHAIDDSEHRPDKLVLLVSTIVTILLVVGAKNETVTISIPYIGLGVGIASMLPLAIYSGYRNRHK